MRRLLPLAGVILLSVTWTASVRADGATKPDLNANAALKYWRGFALMPKLDKDEQDKIARESATMPLTPRAKEIVKLAEMALHELYNGNAVADCAWGVTYDDGVGSILNELPAARQLAGLACLRARQRFEDGNNAGALDDILAALILGRHVSHNGTLIGVLVRNGIDNTATEALAAYLPKLSPAELKTLSARLDKLPAAGSMADALVRGEEKGFLDWFVKKVRSFKKEEQLVGFLDELLTVGEGKKEEVIKGKDFLAACGGNAEGVLKMAEEARPFYPTFAKKMDLPLEQFEKEFAAETKRMEKNPVFKLMAPALGKCRQAEVRREVRQAMLKAAIAVQLDGEGALKTHTDPAGSGPFEYEKFDGGFELKSKFKVMDKTWSLTVGKRK